MERIDIEKINEFSTILKQTDKPIILIPHLHPDGDAMGSVLGLWRVLINAGFTARVISPTKYPEFYHWMDGHREVILHSWQADVAQKCIEEAGLIICMDFNEISRTGNMKDLVSKFPGKKIMIDHHPFPGDFADLVLSDTTSSSTAELTFYLLKKIGFDQYIDRDAATSLFTGIMTDTGSFDYNVSDPRTFETVSELLTFGINQEEIHSNIYDNFSVDRMRLLGHCLTNRMTVYPEFRTSCMYLSLEDQKKFNFAPGDSEGFVNIPLSIKGVIFSALFTEKEKYVKASFRSKGNFAVNEFSSKYFNGGGHRNAAGGELFTSLQEALDKFEKLLPEYQTLLNQ